MKVTVVCSLCALFLSAAPAPGDRVARPVVQHAPATVPIERQPAGQRLIDLPDIEFPLRIQPDCGSGMMLDSLSISIADTRRTFRAADFSAQPAIETTLRIPRRQVSPLAVDSFCSSDPTLDNSRSTMHVADAYSASVSLRCAGDAGQTVVYDTLALDVMLQCAAEDTGADETDSVGDVPANADRAEDQVSSSPFPRF